MTWSPFFAGHARPDVDDDAGALMAEDGGEQPFGIGAGERELVGVADAGRLDLDQYLAGFRPVELDLRISSGLAFSNATAARVFIAGFLLGVAVGTS